MKKSGNKLVSLVLAVTMSLANISVICVSAATTTVDPTEWADYQPSGTMPTNMFMVDDGAGNVSAARNFQNGGIRNTTDVECGLVDANDFLSSAKARRENFLRAVATIGEETANGFYGYVLKNTNSFLANMESIKPSTSYVMSFTAKSVGTSEAKLGLAMSNETPATVTYSKEYGKEGVVIPTEYTDFKMTIKSADNFDSAALNTITLGFPKGTEAGAEVYFTMEAGLEAVYFAKEEAYDITNVPVSGSTFVLAGKEISYKAEVLNQLGLTGYLSQDFDWYVLNEERTEIYDDFSITEDGQVATITVPEGAQSGIYTVAAVSEKYDMVKTAKLEVAGFESFVDHIPSGTMPQNLIGSGTTNGARAIYAGGQRNSTYLNISNGGTWIPSNTGNQRYDTKIITYTPKADSGLQAIDLPTPDGSIFGGLWIRTIDNQFEISNFDPEKSYVFSMRAKNAGATENVRIGLGMSNGATASESYTKEYGTEGMLLTSEYQTFNGTIKPAAGYSTTATNHNLIVGAPVGTKANSVIHIDLTDDEAVYFAEEEAYDIEIETDGDTYIVDNNTLDLSAKVYNQLGLEGYLSQNFEWFALNSDSTDYVDEIQITGDETGRNATASWGNDLENGKYLIVARSKDYGLVRTMTIVIADEYLQDKVETEIPANMFMVDDGAGNVSAARNFQNGGIRNTTDIECGLVDVNDFLASAKARRENFLRTLATIGENPATGYYGYVLKNTNSYLANMELLKPSTSYVMSFTAKSVGTSEARLGLAISNETPTTVTYSEEYGYEGIVIPTEYTKIGMTVKTSDNFDSSATNVITLGFPKGTGPDAKVYFTMEEGLEAVYFAEEKPYKIDLSCDKLTSLSAGSEIDIKAAVVNQVGGTGTLSQSITWYCMNDEGSKTVPGVTIKPYDGGAKVIFGSIPSGMDSVRIYAVSNDYDLVSGINPVALDVDAKQTIYVASDGNDSADGAQSRPLATLEGARDRIRQLTSEGLNAPVDVVFESGTYYFDDTVEFTSEDSRTSSTKVTYKAADGAEVIFTGAVEIDMSGATEITDADILSRIKNDELKGKILEIDLDGQIPYEWSSDNAIKPTLNGICGNYEYPSVYLDGNEQKLAQWPNADGEYKKFTYVDADTIGYSESEPSRWTTAGDWWIGGFLSYDYLYMRVPAVSVDAQNKQINFTVNEASGIMAEDPATDTLFRWKAYNLLEELDMPTEWYIDKGQNKLYYYRPYNNEGSTLEIAVLKTPMITMTESDYIGFEGITFEKTRGDGLRATDVESVTIRECNFNDIGVDAFANYGTAQAESDKNYWQRQFIDASYNCEISNCKFNNIGGHSIIMDGGNVDTLTPSGNVIRNNIFYKGAQKVKNNETVELKGCANTFEYNNISRTSDIAVYYMGNNHVIRYNEIYNVIEEVDDSGAIYCGRNTIQRGTEIAYNYIHDLESTYDWAFNHRPAIYWDDNQTGMYAHHNIIKGAALNVYTNGVDNNYSYNTSIDISKTNIDFRNGGAASNAAPETTAFSGTIADVNLYYNTYANLKAIVTASDRTSRTLALYNVIKGNYNVTGSASAGSNGIGKYTMYSKDPFFGLGGTKNPNVSSNNDNASVTFVNAAAQDYRIKGTSSLSTSVLNENFSIDLIGVQSENNIADTVTLASPYNGEVTNKETVRFVWNDSFGATSYTVTVATDTNFNNVVSKSGTVYTNTVELTVPANGKTYYWKVTATNTSREFASTWESDVYSFKNGEQLDVAYEISGSLIDVTVENNYYVDGVNAVLIVAEYGEKDALVKATVIKDLGLLAVDTSFSTKTAGKTVTLDQTTKKVKLMVWDGSVWGANGIALRDAVTINLSN